MEISQRLRIVGDFVTQKTVADIGTDHAYVPIYLHKKGNVEKVIACDINKKPLQKAQQNIKLYHAENKIITRLGNGLQPLQPYEVDSIVISGMCGMLMIELMEQSPNIIKTVKEFILCHHLDVTAVRKYLHNIGYVITDEKMIQEWDNFYTILRAIPGKQKYDKEIEYIFGSILLEKKDAVLKEYIINEKIRLKKIKQHLYDKRTEQSQKRLQQIEEYKKAIEEAEKWLYCVEKL